MALASLHFQAHLQFAHSNARPKIAKEPSNPSHLNKKLADKDMNNRMIMNNGQQVTRGIKHWGLSGYSDILPRIKFCVTGQESSPQSPTISYRKPLATTFKRYDR